MELPIQLQVGRLYRSDQPEAWRHGNHPITARASSPSNCRNASGVVSSGWAGSASAPRQGNERPQRCQPRRSAHSGRGVCLWPRLRPQRQHQLCWPFPDRGRRDGWAFLYDLNRPGLLPQRGAHNTTVQIAPGGQLRSPPIWAAAPSAVVRQLQHNGWQCPI